MIWNSSTLKKDYIWSKRNGYSLVAANYIKNYIAAAEYGLNPEIHIYRIPGKEMVFKFKADTKIRVMDMVFSRDGKYLLMIGGIPDFTISIFDTENNKLLQLIDNKLPCKMQDYKKTKFNPQNSRLFSIMTQNVMYFYKINQAFDIVKDEEEEQLGELERLSKIEYRNENPELCFTNFIWDQYKRVHICTDLPLILQVDSQTATEESSLGVQSKPLSLLLTQKHMIISTSDSYLFWYRIVLPELQIGDQKQDQKLKILDDIDQEYKFEGSTNSVLQNIDQSEQVTEPVSFMHYSRTFKKIIMGTKQGLIGILAEEAQIVNEDEEEEGHQQEKERKTITTPFVELGRFHTGKITGVRELDETTQLVTISDDKSMAIWEATSQNQIARVLLKTKPTCLDVSKDGKVAFVGSEQGVLRVFDLSNRVMPRLLKSYRFFENRSINVVRCSTDGKYVIVSSQDSEAIMVMSQEVSHEFDVYGRIVTEGYVLQCCFAMNENELKILAVLTNTTMVGLCLPKKFVDQQSRMDPINDSICKPLYRKIDRGINLVMSNIYNGDIFVCGEDKFLKKYEFPTEPFAKVDFKKPPNPPIEELKSNDIGTTCWDYSNEMKFMVTGGKDGNFVLRNMNYVAQSNEVKGHSILTGGITALCFSKNRSMLYTGGGEGSLFAWAVGAKSNPNQPISVQKREIEDIDKIDAIEDLLDQDIKLYKDILLEEFHKSQDHKKMKFKESIMSELNGIKSQLQKLLDENEEVNEIQKLERDEFVIDIEKQNKFNEQGEKICDEIRQDAEKTILRLELLKERIKQTTWDKMEIQSKAVKSIKGDTLIFNYSIRKKTQEESKRLTQIINFRKCELREKISRIESKIQEILDQADFSKIKKSYIMNRIAAKPIYEEDQSILDAAASYAAKDMEKKIKREKEEKKLQQAGQQVVGDGKQKRAPTLKITKGKLGQKTKKIDPNDELKNQLNSKLQQREIKGMEEMFWQVSYLNRTLEDTKKVLENPNIWDLVYESTELYTDTRKQIQIQLLKEVLFELKKDFNKDFESLEKFKEDILFAIKEKNEQIKELLTNLKQEEEIFEPKAHLLENPENIFIVNESEVSVEKFLTKEERLKLEEERKKIEEREKALQGDNVGQRGLKSMMGGTELNLKKDQNMIVTELVKEDWMNKPVEEMNEDERIRLKDFEQKEKEFKEKQRKAWEQELKKLKAEIIENQLKFEERILYIFKKKLFFDVRIYEQELYIIRLTIMLHDAKETGIDEKKYLQERDKLELELQEKEKAIQSFINQQNFRDKVYTANETIKQQDASLRHMFPDVNSKLILGFVKSGRNKKNQGNEPSQRFQELMARVVELDPFAETDKERIKTQVKDEEDKEVYNFERDNTANLNEEDFDRLVKERYARIDFEKERTKLFTQITYMKDFISYLEYQRNEINDKYQQSYASHKKASDRVIKLKYNFEVIVYMKQGQVEVPQLPVATDYKDAILVKKDVILEENKEITRRGERKVQLMEDISAFKTGLKRVKYQNKKLILEIEDFEERAKDVQLYRVTKQTQEIIQGKHQKKDEEDKKRLENQIKQLELNAEKRIKTINDTKQKLRKEIREKMMENDQLETKARQLKQNVDQRKQIMGLKSKTSNDAVQDPSKKIKEISHKRKLVDIAKQQTEEMEFLRDELDRLRARTFPSFAHLHSKPEYPDEI